MIKKNYEIEVLINGKPIKEYFHNNNVYVEGRKDAIFSIRLKNNSYTRVLFVPTIDGLSVIDGNNASFDSSGYIVSGYDSLTIKGWRVSDEQVANFYFSSVDDSYRKRSKKGNNFGSIAVAVFREKEISPQQSFTFIEQYPSIIPQWIPSQPYFDPLVITTSSYADNINSAKYVACSAHGGSAGGGANMGACNSLSQNTQKLGTGFGDITDSSVTTVAFTREDSPDSILEIFYNTRKQLSNMGVKFVKQQMIVTGQNSFPNESKYCQRPN